MQPTAKLMPSPAPVVSAFQSHQQLQARRSKQSSSSSATKAEDEGGQVTKEKEVHHGQDGGEKAGLPPWAYGKDEPDRNAHLANNYNRENKRGQYVDGGFKAKDEYGGAAYGP
jgi:hypothetical protein